MKNVTVHVAGTQALSRLYAPAVSAGLVVGRNKDQVPVPVRAFRPEPTRIALVSGWWLARLLVFRTLALGARVVVFSVQPEGWAGLAEAATGRSDRLRIIPGEQPVHVPASRLQPALYLYDVGPLGPVQRAPLGPWQTQVVLLRQLTQRGYPIVAEADLFMTQRLRPDETGVAASALGLIGEAPQMLQMLYDDMLGLLGEGLEEFAWASPTSVEVQYLGGASANRD